MTWDQKVLRKHLSDKKLVDKRRGNVLIPKAKISSEKEWGRGLVSNVDRVSNRPLVFTEL